MTISQTHDTVRAFLNKDLGVYVPPEQIDVQLHNAQLVLFNSYFQNPKLPVRMQTDLWGKSIRVDEALAPFKEKYEFNQILTPGGVIQLPNDALHTLLVYTTKYSNTLGRNVYYQTEIIPEDELISRIESQVIPLDEFGPIGILGSEKKIQLFPEQAADGAVYYLRTPAVPVYAYTKTGRVVTQDVGNSVDLEWGDTDVMNIIVIALSFLGVQVSSQDVVQYAEAKIQQGQ